LTTAGIIIIGNEILSGKVIDKNSPYLCKELRRLGVEVKQIITIPDVPEVIGKTALEFSKRKSWVFTRWWNWTDT
jgi:Predicted nucleotide-utilizing enzyme related to molybdopterin-biosynthesis enzyme MoeA